jgi:hypothetical protein
VAAWRAVAPRRPQGRGNAKEAAPPQRVVNTRRDQKWRRAFIPGSCGEDVLLPDSVWKVELLRIERTSDWTARYRSRAEPHRYPDWPDAELTSLKKPTITKKFAVSSKRGAASDGAVSEHTAFRICLFWLWRRHIMFDPSTIFPIHVADALKPRFKRTLLDCEDCIRGDCIGMEELLRIGWLKCSAAVATCPALCSAPALTTPGVREANTTYKNILWK